MSIKENVANIRERISAAAERAGRDPAAVKIVAVVKNVPLEKIYEALEAGVTDIGENRVQEAAARYQAIKEKYPAVTRHFIGHLQRNKVGQALNMFDIIQSVDSERLAEEIDRAAVQPVPVLIEVNTSGEPAKFGSEPDKTLELVRAVSALAKVKVLGLMTVGPLAGEVRPAFRKLRELRELAGLRYLSMGMTGDFETAIEEGADLVRIGRGIFQ
ncbi:MAG TPA: YggS family pyridoxal phosphate-dependent enzyme [Candidatus Sulfotelmatobacter sp.]|nr:YggS family pyridoxal phosphate-dependent enzyme [Candidatus Sulfotelmatobacter sp.]